MEDELGRLCKEKNSGKFILFLENYKILLESTFGSLYRIIEVDARNIEILKVHGGLNKSYLLSFEDILVEKISKISSHYKFETEGVEGFLMKYLFFNTFSCLSKV